MIPPKWDSCRTNNHHCVFDAGSKDSDHCGGSCTTWHSSVVVAPGDGYRSRMRGEVGEEEGEYHLAPLCER